MIILINNNSLNPTFLTKIYSLFLFSKILYCQCNIRKNVSLTSNFWAERFFPNLATSVNQLNLAHERKIISTRLFRKPHEDWELQRCPRGEYRNFHTSSGFSKSLKWTRKCYSVPLLCRNGEIKAVTSRTMRRHFGIFKLNDRPGDLWI